MNFTLGSDEILAPYLHSTLCIQSYHSFSVLYCRLSWKIKEERFSCFVGPLSNNRHNLISCFDVDMKHFSILCKLCSLKRRRLNFVQFYGLQTERLFSTSYKILLSIVQIFNFFLFAISVGETNIQKASSHARVFRKYFWINVGTQWFLATS